MQSQLPNASVDLDLTENPMAAPVRLHHKPRLNFWEIWNMSFGFLGIQIGFALQNANVSRIFETLGAKVEAFVRSMPRPDSQRLALARELREANRSLAFPKDRPERRR